MTQALLGIVLLTGIVLMLSAALLLARRLLVPDRAIAVAVNGGAGFESCFGTKLLTALAENGILLPAACGGAGTCGLCRVRVTQGSPVALPAETALLSRAERRGGLHLACQLVLREPIAVEVAEALLAAQSFQCEVVEARSLTPLIREIVLKAPSGVAEGIEAGAFVQVTAPPYELEFAAIAVPERFERAWVPLRRLRVASHEPVSRAYSIASTPADLAAGRIVLLIRLAGPPPDRPGVPPGIVSSWLFQLVPGDRVSAAGPFGSFRAQDNAREMVLIGGGVGLAPLRAIVHDQLDARGTGRKIGFWYGARSREDLLHAGEFEELAARHSNFRWTVALSEPRPGDDWEGPVGFVHAVLRERFLRDHPEPDACDYYLCGPPLMIAAVMSALEGAGVPPERIFFDDFGS
ncbi:LOW QUALITY PROTEIN: Na(+)-translocating NADH-quinone reductase subunit F [Limimaricola cinnabarinus LL-001]|uniref:Na(+)-translocating NADH-quinone reductase subunit F n=1 Tax=Limimaricola cinnabarinus LL-001 TaxID=1337093 RepID=U2YQD5_9RHOB|nr:LOW QUALITY PROTEIN: Na(+)-translocating NADH-quinone reductase subunit F [Limimaricola cinnabarinus LL-001]